MLLQTSYFVHAVVARLHTDVHFISVTILPSTIDRCAKTALISTISFRQQFAALQLNRTDRQSVSRSLKHHQETQIDAVQLASCLRICIAR